jgi:hypothetical protein
MAPPLRVLFYDDAPDFGGHEVQTLAAVRYMASQPNMEVGFVFFGGNARLSRQITDVAAQCPHFRAMPQDYASGAYQAFRTLVSGRAIRRIAAMMAGYAPDVVVARRHRFLQCRPAGGEEGAVAQHQLYPDDAPRAHVLGVTRQGGAA